jgi:hypothetical protein
MYLPANDEHDHMICWPYFILQSMVNFKNIDSFTDVDQLSETLELTCSEPGVTIWQAYIFKNPLPVHP